MQKSEQQHFDVEGAPHGGIGTAPPKDFDEEGDLPITANRTAKWWYVAVHNITAMVGAGVLGLPYAMKLLGELQPFQPEFRNAAACVCKLHNLRCTTV